MQTTTTRAMVAAPPDEEHTAHLRRSIDAGARGDLAASLEHEVAGPFVLESPHRFFVKDLLDQGDAAPAWAYSRWCADLAYRWLLLTEDDRVSHAVGFVMNLLHPGSVAEVRDDPLGLQTLGTHIAAGDGLAVDVALYELGGLAHFLDHRAQPGLLARTDRIQEWASARPRVCSIVGLRGCRLVVHDLVANAELEVLNLGALSGWDADFLVGRLVPITAEPGWMFADRPIPVDAGTALDVADALRDDEPLEWLLALAGAVSAGRLVEAFHCVGPVSFISDLPELAAPVVVRPYDEAGPLGGEPEDELEQAPRIAELRARGCSTEVANAIGVLEVGLIAADLSDHTAAVIGPRVAAAMQVPGAYEAATLECTQPRHSAAWRVLAAVVPEHLAQKCRSLAELAGAVDAPPLG